MLKSAAAVAGTVLLAGCSTVMNQGTQSMTVTPTEGDDVKAMVTTPSGSYETEIPTTITADPAHSGVQVRITDPRYQEDTIQIGQNIDGTFWANFLLFSAFPLGMAVDAGTGTMWDYDNQTVIPVQGQPRGETDQEGAEG